MLRKLDYGEHDMYADWDGRKARLLFRPELIDVLKVDEILKGVRRDYLQRSQEANIGLWLALFAQLDVKDRVVHGAKVKRVMVEWLGEIETRQAGSCAEVSAIPEVREMVTDVAESFKSDQVPYHVRAFQSCYYHEVVTDPGQENTMEMTQWPAREIPTGVEVIPQRAAGHACCMWGI
jgi:hypothetical protein